ncbi:MAG: hypothetical protein Q9227_006630 [Pyrenula ochraceoflavens]
MDSEEPPSPPPKQAPALPPKEPPRVPPKDVRVRAKRRYRDAPRYRDMSPVSKDDLAVNDLIELEPEDYDSDADEDHPLIPSEHSTSPSPSKTRSWVLAIALAFIVTLAVILLWPSTSQHKENAGPFRIKARPSPAKDYALNFPEQYPPLRNDATEDCKTAWAALDSVSCHSQIWSRSWDNSRLNPLGPDLSRYLPQVCTEECTEILRQARTDIGGKCWSSQWDMRGYNGRFNTTLLEPTPAEAIDTLAKRQDHNCRTSPNGDAERNFCMIDLEQRWWIWDGMNANHMRDLNNFVRFTNERKVEPGKKMKGTHGGDDWQQTYDYWREERRFGPGKGETDCNFCTANWFVRMLGDWRETTVDEDGRPIDLPHYLSRIHRAGRRCDQAGASFEQMFDMIGPGYEELLPDDWMWTISDPKSELGLGDGPTFLHEPLPAIRASVGKLDTMINRWDSTPEEYRIFLEDFHEAALSLTCNALITYEDLERFLCETDDIAPLCTSTCQYSRSFLSKVFRTTQPHAIQKFDRFARTHNLANPTVFEKSNDLIDRSCRKEKSRFLYTEPCSIVWNKYRRLSWIKNPQTPDITELVSTVQAALEDLPPVPEGVAILVSKRENELSSEERSALSRWRRPLINGACSPCFWRQFVGEASWADPKPKTKIPGIDIDIPMEADKVFSWLRSMRSMHERCAASGVVFDREELLATEAKIVAKFRNVPSDNEHEDLRRATASDGAL